MIEFVVEQASGFIIQTIQTTGYAGIFFLMALESANLPVPSEIIMPFSGFLVFEGEFLFLQVVLWGTLGNVAGSYASYLLGRHGGRPFMERYGKYLFITSNDLELAEKLFTAYGTFVVFLSRMLPIVRTFISFPAGMARMHQGKFLLYTLMGSFLWSVVLTYAGMIAGANWELLGPFFRKFDWLIAFCGVLLVIWWIRRHMRAIL